MTIRSALSAGRRLPTALSRKVLLWAFALQALAILLCLITALRIYSGFQTRLKQQFAIQQTQARALAAQQDALDRQLREIHDARDALARSYFNRGLELLRAQNYSDAAGVLQEGLRVEPGDGFMRRALVKALIRGGDPAAALRAALGPRGNLPLDGQDFLTIAIARCAAHDEPNAVLMLKASKLSVASNADAIEFCPATTLAQATKH